jgi:putative thioredoxin
MSQQMTQPSAYASDVTTATFQRDVLEASHAQPVIVDFWAPWCAPCRALKPILEKLANEYGGRFRLAKVNSDENPEISSAYGIRSIPDVYAFRDGKPVSHFLGALPESQVRAFIDQVVPSPSEVERLRAAALRGAGDAAGALAALERAVALDARNALARLDLAELLIAARRLDEAEALLAQVAPDAQLDARVEALRASIGYERSGASGTGEAELQARLASNPADHEARLTLAQRYAAAKRYAPALDELLEIVRRDKEWKDGEARRQIVNIFNLAEDPELVSEYRRKLSSALY